MDTNTEIKNIFPQRDGEICMGNNYRWALDGQELKSRDEIEIQIGGHWLRGTIVDPKHGDMIWSSWAECVTVPLMFGIKARRRPSDNLAALSEIERAKAEEAMLEQEKKFLIEQRSITLTPPIAMPPAPVSPPTTNEVARPPSPAPTP